jgi:hypothetical protein
MLPNHLPILGQTVKDLPGGNPKNQRHFEKLDMHFVPDDEVIELDLPGWPKVLIPKDQVAFMIPDGQKEKEPKPGPVTHETVKPVPVAHVPPHILPDGALENKIPEVIKYEGPGPDSVPIEKEERKPFVKKLFSRDRDATPKEVITKDDLKTDPRVARLVEGKDAPSEKTKRPRGRPKKKDK